MTMPSMIISHSMTTMLWKAMIMSWWTWNTMPYHELQVWTWFSTDDLMGQNSKSLGQDHLKGGFSRGWRPTRFDIFNRDKIFFRFDWFSHWILNCALLWLLFFQNCLLDLNCRVCCGSLRWFRTSDVSEINWLQVPPYWMLGLSSYKLFTLYI